MTKKDMELKQEREHLEKVHYWLEGRISDIEKHRADMENKIKTLSRASKGSYNEELENSKLIYKFSEKSCKNYNEAKAQPYFARIDFREYKHNKESLYLGKFPLSDDATGEEVVIDWRAPVADLYYSGTEGQVSYKSPSGVIDGELYLKRKFLFKEDKIKDIFDEGLNEIIVKSGLGEEALVDEFLRINLEESTGKKLKDVVATIQKEQNEVIRAEKNIPLIVQGSAGTGKTTVALHRLAYLLYRYNESLSGKDILVIAPNMLFLDYISEVLPGLGVDEVKQTTFEALAKELLGLKQKINTKDTRLAWVLENKEHEEYKYVVNCCKVKGSLTYKTIMDRLTKIIERDYGFTEDILYEGSVVFPLKDIKRLFLKDLTHLPIKKRKEEIRRYLKARLDARVKEIQEKSDFKYEYMIARVKKLKEDGPERRRELIELYNKRDSEKESLKAGITKSFNDYFTKWNNLDVIDIYKRFFNEEDLFSEATAGKIPKALASYMKNKFNENYQAGTIDNEDLAPLVYLQFLFYGVPEGKKYSHIVIDEAQDYSLYELDIIRNLVNLNSLTIVGDIGQGIYSYKGVSSWQKVIQEDFQNNASYMTLAQSYRSTVEIINLANKILKHQQVDLKPGIPVLRHGKEPEIKEFKNYKLFAEEIDTIVDRIKALGKSSIAIICKSLKECKLLKDRLNSYSNNQWQVIGDNKSQLNMSNMIIPCYMTKGLEFDCTVIYNCSSDTYEVNEEDSRLLYVALTRALHEEYIFYKGKPSELLLD